MQMARTPGPANDVYGFANWYLNTARKELPNAPASALWFEGNGNNIIYIDWENDIVALVRWINPGPSLNDVVGKMLASIKTPTQPDALATMRPRTLRHNITPGVPPRGPAVLR